MDLGSLLSSDQARAVSWRPCGVISSVEQRGVPQNRRFEGFYGRLYSRVIQTPTLRRAAFSLWGSAEPLLRLEAFVGDAVRAASSASGAPVLVDLPSGSGTLLPLLGSAHFRGTVVEADLSISMLRLAQAMHRSSPPGLEAVFIEADALELPLRDAVAHAVVSINGLHVMSDPARFLTEAARITKPGGTLWLITPIDGPSLGTGQLWRPRARSASRRACLPPRPICASFFTLRASCRLAPMAERASRGLPASESPEDTPVRAHRP